MRDRKGYVAIIIACFIPVVMSLIYLSMHTTQSSTNRIIFENAVRQAALEAARNYMCGVPLADQKDYTERCAATTFNAAMKSLVGLENDVIPMKEQEIPYAYVEHPWFGYFQFGCDRQQVFYERWIRPEAIADYYRTADPDADESEYIVAFSSSSGGFLRRTSALGSDAIIIDGGTKLVKKIFYRDAGNSNNTSFVISEKGNDNLLISVETRISSTGQKYKASFTATRPQLNADIVIGIPVNDGAMWWDNLMYSGFVASGEHNVLRSSLFQIKSECKKFIRGMLSFKNCGIGIIPYAGKVAVESPAVATGYAVNGMQREQIPQIQTISHGSYDYSNYDAVNPQVPLAESYKWISCINGIGVGSLSDYDAVKYTSNVTNIAGIMHRADLITQKKGGDLVNADVKDLLLSTVDNNTVFLEHPIWVVYGGDANIAAGYSRAQYYYHPIILPMLGLTDKKIEMYRYCSFLNIFGEDWGTAAGVHFKNRSSFVYLPVIFGMSMLENGFIARNRYNVAGNGNKKILILFVNQPDLFHQHELTHFGFSNDASYFTLVDGDRLDYEKGEIVLGSDGYYRNKEFTQTEYNQQPSGVIYGNSAGEFLTQYNNNVALKCTYPVNSTDGQYTLKMPQPANLKIVTSQVGTNQTPFAEIYVDNGHESGVSVTNVTTSGSGKIVQTADYYTCYVPDSTNGNTYTVTFSNADNRTNPVCAKLILYGCEVDGVSSTSSSAWVVRQDTEAVYICYNDHTSNPPDVTFSITLKQATSATQHTSLSYAGKRITLLPSSSITTISPGSVTSYNLGDVYNIELYGHSYLTFRRNKTLNCPAGVTTPYNFCVKIFDNSRAETYNASSVGVRLLERIVLGWQGAQALSFDGFSPYSVNSLRLTDITAKFNGANNGRAIGHDSSMHIPLVRIYKNQPHSDVEVTGVAYVHGNDTYTDRYVLDMGDYFVAYSTSPENTFRITVSNPNNCKSVYVKMELFGMDISSTSHSKCTYRHDKDFLYICYNGTEIGTTDSFDVYFTYSNTCVSTTPLSHFGGYLLPATYNSSDPSKNMLEKTWDGSDWETLGYQLYVNSDNSLTHYMNTGYIYPDYIAGRTIYIPFTCYNVHLDDGVWYMKRDGGSSKWSSAISSTDVATVTEHKHGVKMVDKNTKYMRFLPSPMNNGKNNALTVNFSYGSLYHKITATPYDTTTPRTYKSKDQGDLLRIPHVIIYKKPGHYVASTEGSTNATEYETVANVEKNSVGVCTALEDGSGWIMFCPEGIKTRKNGSTIEWYLDNPKAAAVKIVLKENLPAYPVLVKIKCFDVDAPCDENGNEITGTYTRQDGTFFYLCNRTYKDASKRASAKSPASLIMYNTPKLGKSTHTTWWELGYVNMFLLGCGNAPDADGTTIDTSTCTFYPTGSEYTIYGCNCDVTANSSYSHSRDPEIYYVPGKVKELDIHTSYIPARTNTECSCDYIDYYCTYNGYPDGALLETSINYFSSISILPYYGWHTSSFTRTFKTVPEAKSKIIFSGANDSSYTLSGNYSVIYIPRNKLASKELSFFLERAKIISIEWSNHLNGTEGCYECANSNGNGNNVDVYYEQLKRGKNCRWINFRAYKDAAKQFPFEHSSLGIITDNYGYQWYDDTFFLQGNKDANNTRTKLFLYTNPVNSILNVHGDFNVIADNAERHPGINVWSIKQVAADKDGHATEFNYMHGVERYFQRHLDTYTAKSDGGFDKDGGYNEQTGTDRFGIVFRVTSDGSGNPLQKVRLGIAECSNEVNRILMGAGYQKFTESSSGDGISDDSGTGLPDKTSTEAMRSGLTPDIIKAFNSKFGDNGRIYVIHYRYDPKAYASSGWDPDSWGVYKNYKASTETELNKYMKEILSDIEGFAGYQDAKIVADE